MKSSTASTSSRVLESRCCLSEVELDIVVDGWPGYKYLGYCRSKVFELNDNGIRHVSVW